MQGTVIDGKYEVIRQLGQGGMGAIYEAKHRSTGRKVAVKVITPEALLAGPDIIARFQREARASGSIDSPHVVQVLDAGVDPSTNAPYMAMECLSGEDLQAAIRRLGPLPPDTVLRIIAHACQGLQKAHEAGIVHRDIKSANLFLASRDDHGTSETITKVLDFGIAKVRADPLAAAGSDHHLTKTGAMLGSPVYMSPEQALGAKDVDARSDIYSMGVVMYEALTGASPNGHRESLGQLLMAICYESAQPLQDRAPWVSTEIAEIVHKALARKTEDRYQTAAELRAAIESLLPDGATTITDGMLEALPLDLRNHQAPRRTFVQPASALLATVIPADGELTDKGVMVVISEGRDLADAATPVSAPAPANDAPHARERRRFGWAAVIGVLAIGGGGGIYYAQHDRAEATGPKPFAPVAESASVTAPPTVSGAQAIVSAAPTDAAAPLPAKLEIASAKPVLPAIARPGVAPRTSAPVIAAPKPSAPSGPAIDRSF